MTDQQPLDLAPIQARHQAATGGEWRYESYAGLGPHGVLGAANIPIGRLDFGEGDQADADRRFVLNAHTDTGKLIAEVLRLRAENETAHVRLYHIQARVEQTALTDPASGLALDLIPWLDGPLHQTDIDDYHAAQGA